MVKCILFGNYFVPISEIYYLNRVCLLYGQDQWIVLLWYMWEGVGTGDGEVTEEVVSILGVQQVVDDIDVGELATDYRSDVLMREVVQGA